LAQPKDVTKDSNVLDYPGPQSVPNVYPPGQTIDFIKSARMAMFLACGVSGHSTTTPPQLPAQPR